MTTAEIEVCMKRTDADADSSTADARPILPQWPSLADLRQAMISEAAYFRSLHRGFAPGRELDDWLAAEVDIGSRLP